jgi:hypothetical protein
MELDPLEAQPFVPSGKIPQSTLYKQIKNYLSSGILVSLEENSNSFMYLDGRLRQVLDKLRKVRNAFGA